MPKVCAICQQVTSKLMEHCVDGKAEELCKKCKALAETEDILPSSTPAAPPPSVHGFVKGSAGGIEGVMVTVQWLEVSCVTSATGAFTLGAVASMWLSMAASDLFVFLTERSLERKCEPWLQEAIAAGDIPAKYQSVLRHADIGASIDHDTFVSLMTRADLAARVAPKVFGTLRRSPQLTLSFTKPGFSPCFSLVDVMEHASTPALFNITMQQVVATGIIDPFSGGIVVDARHGASVTLAPLTKLIQSDGSAYDGEVMLSFSIIDVTTEEGVEAMPGDFSASDISGKPVQIESFGAMWVGMAGNNGQSLQISDCSQGLELQFMTAAAVKFDRQEVPPSIWEFDAVSGKWKQDASVSLAIDDVVMPKPGADPSQIIVKKPAPPVKARAKAKGKKKASGGDEWHALDHGGFLEEAQTWTREDYEKFLGTTVPRATKMTNIKREGYWNCDRPYFTCFVAGAVVDSSGVPVTKANIFSKGKNYSGASPRTGFSDEGRFVVLAQCQSEIELIILVPTKTGGIDRFKFGPFKTSPPGAQGEVGMLRLSNMARCHAD